MIKIYWIIISRQRFYYYYFVCELYYRNSRTIVKYRIFLGQCPFTLKGTPGKLTVVLYVSVLLPVSKWSRDRHVQTNELRTCHYCSYSAAAPSPAGSTSAVSCYSSLPRKVRQATSAPSLFPTWTVPRKQMWNLKTSLVWRSKSQWWERVENIVNILLVWAYNSAFAKSINSSFQVQFDRIYACLFRKWPFGGFVLQQLQVTF